MSENNLKDSYKAIEELLNIARDAIEKAKKIAEKNNITLGDLSSILGCDSKNEEVWVDSTIYEDTEWIPSDQDDADDILNRLGLSNKSNDDGIPV